MIFAAASVVLIAAFLGGTAYYRKHRAARLGFMAQENAATFVRAHSPTLGDDGAKVYLVKFTDPACETCASFSHFVKEIMAAHPGKIKLVIRYAPFHEGADVAARILEAAKMQGKFWETLDLMYASQGYWTQHHQVKVDRLWNLLPRAGLDVARVRRDINDPAITAALSQDLADAQTLDVRKTPGFFVNGKPLEVFGAQELQLLIEQELAASY
jgi:protein-disulfide isomerase